MVEIPTRMKTAAAPSLGASAATGEEEEDFMAGKRRTTMEMADAAMERERRVGGTGRGIGVASALGSETDQGGDDNELGCRKGGGEGEVHGQGSQRGQGQGQGKGHWNHGYRRGACTTTDTFMGERGLVERLSGDKGLVSGWGRRVINLSYAYLGWGGGVLCWWRRNLSEAEAKREVGANDEEVRQR